VIGIRLVWAAVLAAGLAGCAARSVAPETAGRLAAADAQIRQGCYRCLEAAIGTLEAAGSGPDAAAGAVAERLFEARLLLALRQRELGIDAATSFAAARAAATRVRVEAGRPPLAALIDLAETSAGDPSAQMMGTRALPYQQHYARVADLLKAVSPLLPASRLGSYVSLSAACEDRDLSALLDRASIAAAHPSTPLLTYRLATCGANIDDHVVSLRAAEPRWYEAAWFLGRRQLATTRDVSAAATQFADAATGLPEAPAVLLSLAGARRALRQMEPALAAYDRVLALSPELRPALLGRVLCLTYLNRHAEAVVTASRMIALGTYLMGDAHYWRAWNRYQLGDLMAAESDAEKALELMANTNAFTLAGVIQYDLKRPGEAESRFLRARDLDASNCQAAWYLGLIRSERPDWNGGATSFEAAAACFRRAAEQARAELAAVERSSDPPETRAVVAAEHQAALTTSRLRAAQSAYNAAQCFARAGDIPRAETYLAMAAEHPELKAQAERLRATLKQP